MLQSKTKTIGYFLLTVLTLMSLTMLTGWSWLAWSTAVFSLAGILYFILWTFFVAAANRHIQPLIRYFEGCGYEFLGQVRVSSSPQGGGADINDPVFFVQLEDRFTLFKQGTAEVGTIRGVPYRVIRDDSGKQHILCFSREEFYLWRRL